MDNKPSTGETAYSLFVFISTFVVWLVSDILLAQCLFYGTYSLHYVLMAIPSFCIAGVWLAIVLAFDPYI